MRKFSPLLLFIVIVSCSKDPQQPDPDPNPGNPGVPAIKPELVKEFIENGANSGLDTIIHTYTYDSLYRILEDKTSDKKSKIYIYYPGKVTILRYNSDGLVRDSAQYTLDTKGLKIKYVLNLSSAYETWAYDDQTRVSINKVISPTQVTTWRYYYSGNSPNADSLARYTDDKWDFTYTFKYFPNSKNTIGPTNFGSPMDGKQPLLLIDTAFVRNPASSNGIIKYEYKYDSAGRPNYFSSPNIKETREYYYY